MFTWVGRLAVFRYQRKGLAQWNSVERQHAKARGEQRPHQLSSLAHHSERFGKSECPHT